MIFPLPDEIQEEAVALVADIEGNRPTGLKADQLSGGANNRVFRLETPSWRYCLKWYFSHPDDPRDRLKHEWEFLNYAWSLGIRAVPQPLAASLAKQLALYEFIPGRKIIAGERLAEYVDQAIDLVCRLNADRDSAAAAKLPNASEACLRWDEHLARVQRRVEKLEELKRESPLHKAAARFVKKQLLPSWKSIRLEIENGFQAQDSPFDEESAAALRVISPSDFGFHNALVDVGTVCFLDFEYAGWDSLVKLVCDFFHQPQVPVPIDDFDRVCDKIAAGLSIPRELLGSIQSFLPVYAIKWCCILLNDFLPTGRSRRSFSQAESPSEAQLTAQLEKAQRKLDSLDIWVARPEARRAWPRR